MKQITTCFFFLILLSLSQRTYAQSATAPNTRNHYSGKVTTLDGQTFRGDISGFGADKLTLAFNTPDGMAAQHELSPEQIQSFQYRRKGSVGRATLFGAIAGAAGGILYGFILGSDPIPGTVHPVDPIWGVGYTEKSAVQKGLDRALPLALAGAAAGLLSGGMMRHRFTIQGNRTGTTKPGPDS
jgi:hypothetical protein